MNVLIAVPWDQETGGIAYVVGHVAQHLQDRGHTVYFLHPAATSRLRPKRTKWDFPGFELNLRPHVDPNRSIRSRLAFAIKAVPTLVSLLALLAKYRIDVVNVHYPSSAFSYFALCRLVSGIKLVVSIHGTDILPSPALPPRVDLPTRRLLNAADAVVSPSAGFAAQCLPALGRAASRMKVIHNGVDLAEFRPVAAPRTAATLLTIASLDPWKGIDVLLRAMPVVRQQLPAARLTIAGTGPARGELEALSAALALEDCVEFLGYQDRGNVRRLLATCSVFVLPSLSEPFGLVVLEALAAGAPVVASKVGGIPEIVEHGVHALLASPGDERALAHAIVLTCTDLELRQRLSTSGLQHVKSRFSWLNTGRAYEQLFTALIDSSQRA